MASASAVDPSTASADGAALQLDSIPAIDLRLLSQSELYTLSLCSPSAFDPRRCDDVVIPKIDRSVFNESAGSRKQTFSRLRLSPAASVIPNSSSSSSSGIRHHTPHLRSTQSAPRNSSFDTDPEKAENSQIIALLKQLFVGATGTDELVPSRIDHSDTVPQMSSVESFGQKRKRGRPRKDETAVPLVETKEANYGGSGNDGEMMKEIVPYGSIGDKDKESVDRDGVSVDLLTLGTLEDPYGAELRRRTEGLYNRDQLLEFLEGLNGQWGSKRKKKMIVEASQLGDTLAKGWKLLVTLRKKAEYAWLDCRSYIRSSNYFVSFRPILIV